MKAIIRIPTTQYGYIEVEMDNLKEGDGPNIIKVHNEFVGLYEATKSNIQKLKDDNF